MSSDPAHMDRKQFRKILNKLGYPISYTQANEAFIEARGEQLEEEQHFDFDKLAQWVLEEADRVHKVDALPTNFR